MKKPQFEYATINPTPVAVAIHWLYNWRIVPQMDGTIQEQHEVLPPLYITRQKQ